MLHCKIQSRHRLNELKKITYIFKHVTKHDIDSGTFRSHTHTHTTHTHTHTHTQTYTHTRAHATIGFMVDYVCKLCYGPFAMMNSRASTGNFGLRLEL